MSSISKLLYRWIRDLHLYSGLFIAPIVLVFAVSTIFLNHRIFSLDPGKPESRPRLVEGLKVSQAIDGIEQARQILDQAGVKGEIQYLRHNQEENRLLIPVMKPRERILVEVDLNNGSAKIEQVEANLGETLVYLHMTPGPHNANVRGNWWLTRVWHFIADSVVYLLLFLSASGIYLWTVLTSERKAGLVVAGAGTLTFMLIIGGLVL